MGLAVGDVLEGKVSGITKFGAFVDLPEGKTGMVHISEVAQTSEIRPAGLALADGKLWDEAEKLFDGGNT